MVNLLGWSAKAPDWQALLREEGAHLHLYHKDNVPGRKLGHVNVVGDTRELVLQRAARIEALLGTE